MCRTFEINSLEDMCDLMCDNRPPRKKRQQWWIFTIGYGFPNQNSYVKIKGTYESAREEMFKRYGDKWSSQYSLKEWKDWLRVAPKHLPKETLLEVIHTQEENNEGH